MKCFILLQGNNVVIWIKISLSGLPFSTYAYILNGRPQCEIVIENCSKSLTRTIGNVLIEIAYNYYY